MWYKATTASVSNGSTIVQILSGDDIGIVQEDGGLIFEGESPVQIKRGYSDGSGNNFIELQKAWPYNDKSSQPLVAFPTDASFAEATAELRRVIDTLTVASLSEAQQGLDDEKIMTPLKTKEAVDFRLDQRFAEVEEELEIVQAANPHPYAMRKVEFEAHRAANNEKFAASGFVHFGKAYSATGHNEVAQGLWTNELSSDVLRLGRDNGEGESKEDDAVLNIAGLKTKLKNLGTSGVLFGAEVKFPPAEDGTRTYDSATGISVTHSTSAIAFASETDTNKVVTDRVDMWGFEAFLREIHDGDPFVYKNGLIQSQSADIDGVTTVTDNVRPNTYFAWYESDTGSIGKGVNWQTATEAQRIAIASNPENNIYFDDETSKFYQWCIRGRSFAGNGNGDWVNVSSQALVGCRFDLKGSSFVRLKGPSNTDANTAYADQTGGVENNKPETGLFTARDQSNGAIDNESYFLVCGTVNRLNKGAYHPQLNSKGSAKWRDSNNATVLNGSSSWSDIQNPSCRPTGRAQAFDLQPTGGSLKPCASNTTGFIGGPAGSGRPDGRLYDAIYASGQGGVCRDMRYSAWGLTPSDFTEADLKIKSGEYRGTEPLSKVSILNGMRPAASSAYIYLDANPDTPYKERKPIAIKVTSTGSSSTPLATDQWYSGEVHILPNGRLVALLNNLGASLVSSGTAADFTISILGHIDSEISVSGNYTHTEVIGDPANILQCDDLKDGWVGSWNPKIPDGTGDRFPLTRKVISTSDDICYYSGDLGDNWLSTVSAFNLIESSNSVANSSIFNTGSIVVYQHSASAKYTENAENMPIFGGYDGIGHVIASSDAYALGRGMLLRESLIGKPAGLSSYTNGAVQSMRPNAATLDMDTLIGATRAAYGPAHDPIVIDGSTSLSGVKALNYNVVEGQQGFIQYAYTEIIVDGDWGDDGKIYIADNQSTRLDDNGNTVLYGTARIVEPLGWIKNDK